MANANSTGRTKGEAKHVRFYEWMLRGLAYRSLSCHARCLLVELYRRHNGENNGEISMSNREAAALLGINKDTAWKTFKQLVDRGFIREHQRGSFSCKLRHATTWILTEFHYAEQLPTKDFMRWQEIPEK